MLAIIPVVVVWVLLLQLRAERAQLVLMKEKHPPNCPEILPHPDLLNNLLEPNSLHM